MTEAKSASGRWVYTSALAKFEGDTDKVRAWDGSIHAGWENSPEFATAEEFYAWAKAECARRNTIETAAPDLLEALKALLEAWPDDHLPAHPTCMAAARAIAKATGQ